MGSYRWEGWVCSWKGWEFVHRFSERITRFFAKKCTNAQFAQKTNDLLIHFFLVGDLSDSPRSLIFGMRFAHSSSFVMSNLGDSLTRLFKKREYANRSCFFKRTKQLLKNVKNMILFLKNWAICSFFVSERANEWFAKKILRFAHLLFYNERPERIAHGRFFVISDLCGSQSLVCHERPERFAHSRSFVLSDLSQLLTVAH